MELNADAPQRPRRGRPPGSGAAPGGKAAGVKAARKAPRTAAKRASEPRAHGNPRRQSRKTTAAAAATAEVDNSAQRLPASQVGHPFARTEKVTSDNDGDDDADEAQDAEVYSGRYELALDDVCAQTSARLGCPLYSVRFVLAQAKEGATVPFLARYRQGETGRMDETQLRQVLDTAKEVKEVHRRRQFMLSSLESRGLLTPTLRAALESMAHVSQLEDAWEPYKERRTSLASRGRAEGLGKYAFALLHVNPEEEQCMALLRDLRTALSRVEDGERLLVAIVAEDVQRSEELRRRLGDYCRQTMRLASTMVQKPRKRVAKEMQEENFEHLKRHFKYYDGKSWSVNHIRAHVLLALQRGEAKGVLQVETITGPKSHGVFMHTAQVEFPDIAHLLPPPGTPTGGSSAIAGLRRVLPDASYCRDLLQSGLQGAYDYLLKQSCTATRRDLKKSAEHEAIAVFAHNLHHMLLQRPLSHSRVLAMDPGHTHGVKCVVLDEYGGVENFFTCTLMDEAKMRQYVTEVVETRKLNKIVIGNGTASAETSELVADLIKKRRWQDVEFAVVSESGASVYSVSDIAKEEFPTLSALYRGAVSIGRRVLDPLSELVKIPVRSMGIGMYQHDVNEKELMRELGYVLESCVAKVGINAVSANRYVMEKVPGIQKRIVDQIVLARHTKKLHSREDLRRVPAMTESVYEQIAGFFRFPNSPEPLDNTNIHPESYPLVRRLVKLYATGQLADTASPPPTASAEKGQSEAGVGDAQTRQAVARALQQLSPAQFAALASQRLSCTVETLELVMRELLHPGLDPRASLPHAGLLRREVHDVKDLRKGEILSGVVQSVTMFGAFVDCGLHDSVLVRGDGVDTLQVGAYLKQRIRFEDLDHMKRPRMYLLPDPAADSADAPARRSQRLRLEAEDVLGTAGRRLPALGTRGGNFHAEDDSGLAVDVVAPQSLSATIERERQRRAREERTTGTTPHTDGGESDRVAPAPSPSPQTPSPSPLVAPRGATGQQQQWKAEEMIVSAPLTSTATNFPQQRSSRAQKRARSPSPESAAPPPQQHVEQAPPSPHADDRIVVGTLTATPRGSGAPRTVFVMGAAAGAATAAASTPATPQKAAAARPAMVDVDEVDVDVVSVGDESSSSGSDVVFSF